MIGGETIFKDFSTSKGPLFRAIAEVARLLPEIEKEQNLIVYDQVSYALSALIARNKQMEEKRGLNKIVAWKNEKAPGHQRGSHGAWELSPDYQGWLDHQFVMKKHSDGRTWYISEPYHLTEEGIRTLVKMIDDGWDVVIRGDSYHYPNSTVSIRIADRAVIWGQNGRPATTGAARAERLVEPINDIEADYWSGYLRGAKDMYFRFVTAGHALSSFTYDTLTKWLDEISQKIGRKGFSITSLLPRKASIMAEATVQLIQDGSSMGVVTDADSPESFISQCAHLLSGLISEENERAIWEVRLASWLPQIIETACKLKGYKADVRERRLIIAGDFSHESFTKAAEAGPGLIVRPADRAGANGNGSH